MGRPAAARWKAPSGTPRINKRSGRPVSRSRRTAAPRSRTTSRRSPAGHQSMDVVWITPEGAVKGAFWNEGDDWELYPDAVADDGSASTQGGLAAVSRTPTSIEVWWIGPDGSVQGASLERRCGLAPRTTRPVAGSRQRLEIQRCRCDVADRDHDRGVVDRRRRLGATRGQRLRQADPFSFRILRPEDLVDLHCRRGRLPPGGSSTGRYCRPTLRRSSDHLCRSSPETRCGTSQPGYTVIRSSTT